MPGVYFHKLLDFSQRLLLCPLKVTVDACSLFSSTPGHFPNVYCYVPWQSQLMPGVYFHKLVDFFPTSTAMSLDSHSWCLEFIFINSRTFSQRLLLCPLQSQLMPGFYFHKLPDFFPTSTAMSLDSHSWCLEFIFINSWTFPNVYCYVPWHSQLIPAVYFHKLLDFFSTSTSMSLDIHSWCLKFIFINSWTFSQRLLLCPLTVTVDAWSLFS